MEGHTVGKGEKRSSRKINGIASYITKSTLKKLGVGRGRRNTVVVLNIYIDYQ